MVKKVVGKECKECGATLVLSCPVKEEEFCAKKKAAVCPSCKYVEDVDAEETKCNFSEK